MCFKMKKLNIFSAAHRKSGNVDNNSPASPTSGDTINRIVNKKEEEKLKWQKQQDDFDKRKRDHEMHLVEIERKEVKRREEEVRQRKEVLGDKRRKHDEIETAISEQTQKLIERLENYHREHKKEENDIENEMDMMKEKIAEVKCNLETRKRELELTDKINETDCSLSEVSSTKDLRRCSSVPSDPSSPDCDSSNAMNNSYSTLTVNNGLLKLENTTKMLETSSNSLSNEIVNASSTVIQLSSGQKLPTRGYTPPPDYNCLNELSEISKKSSSNEDIKKFPKRRLAERRKIIEPNKITVPRFEHSNQIYDLNVPDLENNSNSSAPLPSEVSLKRRSSSFKWKLAAKSVIRTKRLYDRSKDLDSNIVSTVIKNNSTKANAPKVPLAISKPYFSNYSNFPNMNLTNHMNSVDDHIAKNNTNDYTIQELPSSSALQHLVKGRPKRPKKHPPIRRAVLI